MKKESNAMKKLILMSLFILPVAACGEQTAQTAESQVSVQAESANNTATQASENESLRPDQIRSDLCISVPLIDVGEDAQAVASGQKTFPVQMYGYALGQKVDHFPACGVDQWGLPVSLITAPELCFWENKGAIEVTRGLLLSSPYKGALFPADDTYEADGCGTGFNIGLDEDRRIAYMTIRTAGLKDQEYIFDWFKQQLGEPEIYAVVDSSIDAFKMDRSIPLEIRSFWGSTNGAIIAIWRVDGIWVRFLGVGRIDIGYEDVLEQGGKLSNSEILN